jgi:hypothetical protein
MSRLVDHFFLGLTMSTIKNLNLFCDRTGPRLPGAGFFEKTFRYKDTGRATHEKILKNSYQEDVKHMPECNAHDLQSIKSSGPFL